MAVSESGSYAIYVLGETRPSEGLLEQMVFPQGRCHSFLMLVKDGVPAAELHYTVKNSDGQTDKSLNPLNIIGAAAECGGLGAVFNQAAKDLGLDKDMLHLEAVQTSARHRPGDDGVITFGKVEGDPAHILSLWNRACRIALEVNKANIPFTQNPEWTVGDGPANCHAGMKTTLARLGPEFSEAAQNLAQKLGRELGEEVPCLDALPEDQEKETSLIRLEQTRAALAKQLYDTSGYGARRPSI